MIRTQIYLTEKENAAIDRLSHSLGHGKSELIRNAVDEYIARRDAGGSLKNLRAARGMWSGRRDTPDIRKTRAEFDRF